VRPLHVLDTSLPAVAGYTSRARSILENQRALGLDPIAVTGLRQGATEHASELLGGVLHLRTRPLVDEPPERAGLGETLEMAALGGRILEVARQHDVDLIHAHSPILCGIPARLAARWLGVPSVYEIRAFWEDAAVDQGRNEVGSLRYSAIRALETRLARSVDALVVICDGLRRELVGRGVPESRVFTVPNGVDASRFSPVPRDEAFADRFGFRGKTVVAYIGTLFRFEGVSLLLEALDRLTREDDSVRGLVVGYGESEGDLRRLHGTLGLGDRVVLTGKVPPNEIAKYYGLADVLCYPRESHRITELTTPLKPLEALAMEKAVVGSRVGGIRELVKDGETGLLFDAGDRDGLYAVLERLVGDPFLRRALGERGRRDVVATRNWTDLARRYLDVYEAARERRRERDVGRGARGAETNP
jgi:PEP-CTERM/exosortase A-associated glycosyltransferase